MTELVTYRSSQRLGVISLNRPEALNAISQALMMELLAVLRQAKEDPDTDVLIFRGEGRAFCAGADMKEIPERTLENRRRYLRDLQELTALIWNMDKPVIAAIQGYAVGAGCELILNCDLRIAAEDARFGFPETTIGAPITNAGTKTLPATIGLGRARQLFYTGEKIDARKAEAWGLVNQVVPTAELDQAAEAMARSILEKHQLAIKLNRAAVNYALGATVEQVLIYEAQDGMTSYAAGLMDETRRSGDWGGARRGR
ncbi:MAG: enoyl-CoA hydratase/isomerase family protein [Ectothiorhodospiraceae bacterium]|nr:enoyl-CoA hydratase/isomerase family protein [Ectothiorhodospiraceae bacterium]MCH8503268.1 enoyl-CoA hydratase/isomerase family protein [Ectothiorhodospiraceae bacterium]